MYRSASSPLQALDVGTRLWHYDVTADLGEGRMGGVWRNRAIETIRALATVG